MKRILIFMVIGVSLCGLSFVAAAASLGNAELGVDLTLSEYAELIIPEGSLSFGDVDVASVVGGNKVITPDAGIELLTNTDVEIRMESKGFGDEHGVLDRFVEYYSANLSFRATGWHRRSFSWSGGIINVPFEGRFRAITRVKPYNEPFRDYFYQVKAGEYSDTVTFTVSAK